MSPPFVLVMFNMLAVQFLLCSDYLTGYINLLFIIIYDVIIYFFAGRCFNPGRS